MPRLSSFSSQILLKPSGGQVSWELISTIDSPVASRDILFGYNVAANSTQFFASTQNSSFGRVYIGTLATATITSNIAYNGVAPQASFANSIAANDGLLAVANWQAQTNGVVEIYNILTGALLRTLTFPDATPATGAFFGSSTAINSANRLVIGAHDPFSAGGAQKAYLYNAATGDLLRTFSNPDLVPEPTVSNNNFGKTVAVTASYVIISAPAYNNVKGRVYVYDITTGNLLRSIDNPDLTSSTNNFGYSIAATDQYLVVGNPAYDEGGILSGRAYLFNIQTGALLHTWINPNLNALATQDQFGETVAVNDNYTFVASWRESYTYPPAQGGSTGGSSGYVQVFKNTTGELVSTLTNPAPLGAPPGDTFGRTMATTGQGTLVVGASGTDAPTPLSPSGSENVGKVYVYAAQ